MASVSVLQFVNSSGTAGGCTHVFVVFSSACQPDGCGSVGNALVLLDRNIILVQWMSCEMNTFRWTETKK